MVEQRASQTGSKPSILFVSLSLERGGTERHLALILPRLQDLGWPVSIYCLATKGEMAPLVTLSGVEVIAPPFEGSAWFKGPTKAFRLLSTSLKLLWLMVSRRPGIVHLFLPAPYLIGGPLALLTLRPICIMSRRNLNHYLSKRPLAARFELLLHRCVDAILANSASIVSELINEEGCDPNNVGLIRNGIEIDSFTGGAERNATRKLLGIDDKAFVAIIVANLIEYKGHADLIHALSAIQTRMPEGWIVLFAGKDYGAGQEISALIIENGLGDHIRLLGSRRDIPDLLEAADVGLLCSHEEGFSNSVLEGMAANLPMIVTNVGGNSEAVRSGLDGLVVPPHSPQELGEAILSLALDPDRRQKMGQSAGERVATHFSIETCVKSYDRIYRGLLDGQSAAKLAPHEFF